MLKVAKAPKSSYRQAKQTPNEEISKDDSYLNSKDFIENCMKRNIVKKITKCVNNETRLSKDSATSCASLLSSKLLFEFYLQI